MMTFVCLQNTCYITIFAVLLLATAGPAEAFTDLEDFIRILGSLDEKADVVNYFNGSVFLKQTGTSLQKIFNFEGYNINRKLRQQDDSFLSLSREIVVYRHPVTSVILQVWVNPISNEPNEVFIVANDPVNAKLNAAPLPVGTSNRDPIYKIFNIDLVLNYPNPLSPVKYANYSAGQYYNAVEMFGYFANYTMLQSSAESVPATTTWMRKSQYLPWMELGTTPGNLYYTSIAWKCGNGLSCVADDLMELVKTQYPKYQYAPTTDEEPNETSWTVFKKVIDQRRLAGLPDITIPAVNVSADVRPMTYDLDPRVANVMYYVWPLYMRVNGTAWSDITGEDGHALFDIVGSVGLDFEPLPERNGYRVQLDGSYRYYNHTTKRPLTVFNNPITGLANHVNETQKVEIDVIFDRNSMYTIDIPESDAVGLIGAQSMEGDAEAWIVNMVNIIFPYEELAKPVNNTRSPPKFYGTYAAFSSWPEWMKMAGQAGTMATKLTLTNSIL